MSAALALLRAERAEREAQERAARTANLTEHRSVYGLSSVRQASEHLSQAADRPQHEVEAAFRHLRSEAPARFKTIIDALRNLMTRISSPSRTHSEEFHRALWRLSRDGLVSQTLSHATFIAWHDISARAHVPEPIVEADEHHVKFAWSFPDQYLDVDVFENGTFEWFYRDVATGDAQGSDDAIERLPQAFWDHLLKLSQAK